MEELNPTWVRETLLAILKTVRNLVSRTDGSDDNVASLKTRVRKTEIDRVVMLRQIDKLIDEGEKYGSEIASLGRANDRREDRIVRLEKKAGILA